LTVAVHFVAFGATAAVQFPLTHPAVATVLLGCRSAEEATASAADLAVVILARLWTDLAEASGPLTRRGIDRGDCVSVVPSLCRRVANLKLTSECEVERTVVQWAMTLPATICT